MRKLIMISLLLAGFGSIHAAEVSREQAVEMAKARVSGTVSSVKAVSYEGQKVYYVVQFAEGGWVLVSADDTTMPVIGYSNEGVYQSEGQPDNMRSMMDDFSRQIIDNKRTLSRRHNGWEAVEVARARTRASETIEPLITVKWNQTGSYQKYCPEANGKKAVVGCVAVGMAQAMSVAQWPPRPVGEWSYPHSVYGSQYINYDKEPDYNWSNILSGANNNDDVARLLRHCGVSVNMDYGPDGSGTQDSYIASALKRNFQYPQSVKYYSRKSFENADDEWEELILNELRDGRAVAYSGSDPNSGYGHCFNLDGYDGQFFHVNWGWGGANNAYFPLNGLKDAKMGYTYTQGQSVIVGIRPPSEKPSDITLSANTVQGGQPAGTYVCDVIVESEATNPVYSYTLKGSYNPITHTASTPPFKIEDDKLYTTKVLDAGKNQKVTIIAKNTKNGGSVERTFNIKVTTGPVGVTEVNAECVGPRQYFSASGMQLSVPGKGLTIIRQRMSDGTTKTVKALNN